MSLTLIITERAHYDALAKLKVEARARFDGCECYRFGGVCAEVR